MFDSTDPMAGLPSPPGLGLAPPAPARWSRAGAASRPGRSGQLQRRGPAHRRPDTGPAEIGENPSRNEQAVHRPALPCGHQREEVVQLSSQRFGTLEVAGR